MQKPKRAVKSRDELIEGQKKKQEIARKRKIIVDGFYPKLVEATVSVDESKMLIQAMSSVLMEEVLGWMKDRKIDEILPSMIEKLCPEEERKEEITNLLRTLEGETLFVAREIIEGMSQAITQMMHDEMKKKKLSDLEADWDKFLN